MREKKEQALLKKGIWIQEQHGTLTMGTLDKNDDIVVELSPGLSASVFEFEQDMMDAMYGENAVIFKSDQIHVKKMFLKVVKGFDVTDVRVSVSCTPENAVIKGDYDQFFNLMTGFVKNSLEFELKITDAPAIYINASVLENNLCIIYRDSGTGSPEKSLKKEFDVIKEDLNGEITQKITHGKGSYFDIIIPVEQV